MFLFFFCIITIAIAVHIAIIKPLLFSIGISIDKKKESKAMDITKEQATPDTCIWKSFDNKHSCQREKYNDNDYCLFHKPDKNHDESVLFWKVLTFRVFNGIRPEDNFDSILFHYNPAEFKRRSESFFAKIKVSIESNFQNGETQNQKDEIINLVKQKINKDDVSLQTCLDFKGFVFPAYNGFDRFNRVENVPVTQKGHEFKDIYDFSYAEFKYTINFYEFHFVGKTNFNYTKFSGVTFDRAVFYGMCSFVETKFSPTSFYMDCGMFVNTEFRYKSVLFKDSERLDLTGAIFAPNSNPHLEYTYENERGDQEKNFKAIKEHFRRYGNFEKQVEMHFKELHSKMYKLRNDFKLRYLLAQIWSDLKQSFKQKKRIFNYDYYSGLLQGYGMSITEFFTGYLLKPYRILLTMFLTLILFSFFYFFGETSGVDKISISQLNIGGRIINSIYFSAVTFTTLGYGDFSPVSSLMKICCTFECLLGIFLSSLFIVSLAKRVLRE